MDVENINSRRDFIRKVTLTSLVAASLPEMLVRAAPLKEPEEDKGNGFVFLFQGDSITDGKRGRNNDLNHIMGHGYAFSIASRLGADFAEKRLVFYNRGISGNKVTDLAARWQQDTLDLKPNVLSILIGVNDVNVNIDGAEGATAEKFEEVYRSLLDQTKDKFPDILFVLCEPFILPVGKVKDRWDKWWPEMQKRQEVVNRLAKDYNAVFVELQPVFDNACKRAPTDYWIWDGIHPTVAGHELIAREWIKQVSKRLRFLK
jgi:lysophospholipase L1-like esterase